MIESMVSNTPQWLLVFARMGGLLAINPLFSRRNVPAMVRAGLIYMMTAIIAPTLTVDQALVGSSLDLAINMVQEVLVGIACGFVFQIFYYMLVFAGDMMDTQFGLSMAKVFDPGTSIQMSVSGNLINLLFVLYFFVTNSHLLLIRIYSVSFQILPVGAATFSSDSAQFVLELFIAVFSMALRLAVPFIAAEFVLELAMGVLMKLIPQIHIFVINIQFRLLLGIILLLAFANPIASFLDNYTTIMLENLQEIFFALGS